MGALVHEVLVDLVRDGQEVVAAARLGDHRELGRSEDLPYGVQGRVEDHEARLRRDRGLEGRGVEPEVVALEGHHAGAGPRHGQARRVGVVEGLEEHGFVARLAEGLHAREDGLGGPGVDRDLAVGVVVEAVEAPLVLGHRLPQLGLADHRAVLVPALADGRDGGLLHEVGPVEIGIALAQVDGAVLRGERGVLREDRGPEAAQPTRQVGNTHGAASVAQDTASRSGPTSRDDRRTS